jgi:hypothetical protein
MVEGQTIDETAFEMLDAVFSEYLMVCYACPYPYPGGMRHWVGMGASWFCLFFAKRLYAGCSALLLRCRKQSSTRRGATTACTRGS